MKKICFSCKEEKDVSEFYKRADRKSGYLSYCKICNKIKCKKIYDKHPEKAKKYSKNWTLNNKERKEENDKKYRKEHKEEINKNARKWKKNNPVRSKANNKRWRDNNPEKVKELSKKRRENPQYRIGSKISNGIYNAMKKRSSSKKGRSSFNDILSYSVEDLLCHLESLFEEGMTWENHGQGEDKWQIDHVIPDSWFDYENFEDEEFQKSWALENLQPMWANENISKNNRYAGKYKGGLTND